MVDLKLVKVFITIFDTQSVSLAAQKLNITQPSVSHGLSRLRHLFKDQLFIRSKQGMIPTAYATKLYGELYPPFMDIERVMNEVKTFDVGTSDQCFKVAVSDIGELYILPKILSKLSVVAPNIRLEIVAVDMYRLADDLITGKVDVAICDGVVEDKKLSNLTFLKEKYLCLLHQQILSQDDLDVKNELSLDLFLKEKHVVVDSSMGQNFIDHYLNQSGLKRNIQLRISQFALLPELIQNHRYIAILTSKIALLFQSNPAIQICELPLELPELELTMHWHHKSTDASAKKWLIYFLQQTLTCVSDDDEHYSAGIEQYSASINRS